MNDDGGRVPDEVWLKQLEGEWTYETECGTRPDGTPQTMSGTESVRALGTFRTVAENRCPAHDGSPEMVSIITLGRDAARGRFIGTFVSSCMAHLWPYDGALDETGRKLSLDSQGPSLSGGEGIDKYRDVIEIESPDRRTLRALVLEPDGGWREFMTSRYRRTS